MKVTRFNSCAEDTEESGAVGMTTTIERERNDGEGVNRVMASYE